VEGSVLVREIFRVRDRRLREHREQDLSEGKRGRIHRWKKLEQEDYYRRENL